LHQYERSPVRSPQTWLTSPRAGAIMAVEPRRGCGYRKVGGLYLVSDGPTMSCARLPIPLTICPVCSHGLKQTRGWTWVDAGHLLAAEPCAMGDCSRCPLSAERLHQIGRAGLLWIGGRFYPTPRQFDDEANAHGVSRRIRAVPKDFVLGQTWVLLAHPKAVDCGSCDAPAEMLPEDTPKCVECKGAGSLPGIFRLFKPQRIEKIVTESQAQDTDGMQALREKGITPVAVPDNDPDHRGTVYERDATPVEAR
jgi:hypothetical protein